MGKRNNIKGKIRKGKVKGKVKVKVRPPRGLLPPPQILVRPRGVVVVWDGREEV